MEYAPNGNLFHFMRRNKDWTISQRLGLFAQIVDAIAYIHTRKVIHRDIKPENILVDSKFQPKICDFGWSSVLKNDSTRKTFCGTYEYMAPEIFESAPYTEKVDIWSLGILLYELLHGYSPFRAPTLLEIYKNILKRRIKFADGISEQAVDLITKILRYKPEERLSVQQILAHPFLAEHVLSRKGLVTQLSSKKINSSDGFGTKPNSSIMPTQPSHESKTQIHKLKVNLELHEPKLHKIEVQDSHMIQFKPLLSQLKKHIRVDSRKNDKLTDTSMSIFNANIKRNSPKSQPELLKPLFKLKNIERAKNIYHQNTSRGAETSRSNSPANRVNISSGLVTSLHTSRSRIPENSQMKISIHKIPSSYFYNKPSSLQASPRMAKPRLHPISPITQKTSLLSSLSSRQRLIKDSAHLKTELSSHANIFSKTKAFSKSFIMNKLSSGLKNTATARPLTHKLIESNSVSNIQNQTINNYISVNIADGKENTITKGSLSLSKPSYCGLSSPSSLTRKLIQRQFSLNSASKLGSEAPSPSQPDPSKNPIISEKSSWQDGCQTSRFCKKRFAPANCPYFEMA